MMKLRFDTSKWQKRISTFEPLVRREVDKAFLRLIRNARSAMNEGIEDYPSNSNTLLQETLEEHGIAPRPGLLRSALEKSMDEGTKTRKYGTRYSRKIIDYDILNSLTPWGGVGGKRPIQTPRTWESNPYPSSGFWKTYNDGFDFGEHRIYGRNFIVRGENYIKRNFNHEMSLAIRRIFYYLKK